MIQAGTASQTQAMPLVKLSENSLLRLMIPVPESAVSKIRVGEGVDVRVAALNKTWPGVVARFSDSLNEDTRMMHTEVDVKNADLVLVPGMFAEAKLTLDERHGVLVVPVQAIDREQNATTVMVVTPANEIAVRTITTGLESSDRVEVRTGLQEGDTIVVAGRGALKEGLKVTPKITAPAGTEEQK
jgi:RND family efflux transporter MFP subunit